MTALATLVYLLVAAGMTALAAKYAFGAVPAPHHAQMMHNAVEPPGPATLRVIGALYRVMAGALAGAALALAAIGWFGLGLAADAAQPWARWTLPLVVLAIGVPTTLVTRQAEHETGIRTPWRPAAGLTGAGLVAFLLSLV